MAPARASAPGTLIPFDYAASFKLIGAVGNVVQDVIKIIPDGVFVAVAIGYGFLEDRARNLEIGLVDSSTRTPGEITLKELPKTALVEGFQVDPDSSNIVFAGEVAEDPEAARRSWEYSKQPVAKELINKCFQLICPRRDISFLFSMVDSSTGRELQDEPTHNIASLGTSTGERPFRLLAQPVSFLPRSTIRLQVIERTPNTQGKLYIVLYGYHALVSSACPEPTARALLESAARPAATPGQNRLPVIPFDYVTKFKLTGRPSKRVDDEVTVNAEGGFVATALGYGLAVEKEEVAIQVQDAGEAVQGEEVNLQKLSIKAFPASALHDGIRIRPEYLRIALDKEGNLRTALPLSLANEVFERLNFPEEVSFLYTISDTAVGREWQNQPVYNLAGLGIANGLRPFKKFARPRFFPPRTTIRVSVEEVFGRGELFIVFQGYKILGAPLAGGRP